MLVLFQIRRTTTCTYIVMGCVPVGESVHSLEVLFEEEEKETGLGAATALCQVSQVTPSLSCRGAREGGRWGPKKKKDGDLHN